MTLRRSTAARNAVADAEAALLDGGSVQFRTGAQPTNVGDAAGGMLLGTVTLGNPAAAAASSGVATFNAITSDTNADNSGTAGHARLLDNGGAISHDASCGMGSGDFNFDNNVIVATGTIAVNSAALTAPIS